MSGWLVDLLVMLGVLCIVIIAAWFVLSQIEMPEPIRKIITIVAVIVVAVIAVVILLQLPGGRARIGGDFRHSALASGPTAVGAASAAGNMLAVLRG